MAQSWRACSSQAQDVVVETWTGSGSSVACTEKMPGLSHPQVFLCLVDGCEARFCSAAERKQHLVDLHAFPNDFSFERMHVRQKHRQRRPDKAYQRSTRGRGSQRYQKQPAAGMHQLTNGLNSLSMS